MIPEIRESPKTPNSKKFRMFPTTLNVENFKIIFIILTNK